MYNDSGTNSMVLALARAYRSLSGLYHEIVPVPLRAVAARPVVIATVYALKDGLIKVDGTMGTVAMQAATDGRMFLAKMEMSLRMPVNPASLHITNSIRHTIEEHFASLVEFWLKNPHADYNRGIGLIALAKQNAPIAPCTDIPPHLFDGECYIFDGLLLMERGSEYGPVFDEHVNASWRASWRNGYYTFNVNFGEESQ